MADLLIVDDESPLAMNFTRFFERKGHTVRRAASGEAALALWHERRPDVTLLDLRLPDMSGFDVFARIRHEDPMVIMVSGYADISMAVRAVQDGVENFLTKPVELSHLGVVVDRALEKLRVRQLSRYLTARRASGRHIAIGSSPRMQELARQVKTLQGENARLREDLSLFEELASGSSRDKDGLAVSRFMVEPIDPERLHYRLLVTLGGRKDRDFQGSLQFLVNVQEQGRNAILTFPANSETNRQRYAVNFRHFQRLEGDLLLPRGVVATGVEVRVLQSGQVRTRATSTL
jgi:DNA-binding response OmpR family regulator